MNITKYIRKATTISGFLLTVLGLYLFGSFLAWDFNPMHWWMIGRFAFAIACIVLAGIMFSNKH